MSKKGGRHKMAVSNEELSKILEEAEKKPDCPFFKTPCRELKCALYATMTQAVPSQVVGVVRQEKTGGCAFLINLKLMAQLSQQLRAPMMGTMREPS